MPVFMVFAILCAWESSEWLFPALSLDPVPFGIVSAVACAVMAGLALVWRGKLGKMDRRDLCVGAYGAGALALPGLMLVIAQRFFAVEVAVAALAGVPVVVVVMLQAGATADEPAAEALLPALMGLAGALLLIPVRLPANTTGWIGFGLDLAAVLCAGIFGVLGHRKARVAPLRSAVASVAAGNAVVFAGGAALLFLGGSARLQTASVPGAGTMAGDLLVTMLTVLGTIVLLRGMAPLGFAARFLLIPLLGAVEAYALLRPSVSFRAVVGALLMLAAVVRLLRGVPAVVGSFLPPRSSI